MKKKEADPRITLTGNGYVEFLLIWLIMLCLTSGQIMIFDSYLKEHQLNIPWQSILASMGYWAMMTSIFCLITAQVRRKNFVLPMERIGEAARRVAQGDFSVYLPPMRKDGKKDYKEVIFDDFNKMVGELGSTETLNQTLSPTYRTKSRRRFPSSRITPPPCKKRGFRMPCGRNTLKPS